MRIIAMPNCYGYENDYLIHYGILGQKWGRRRYQNEDGTLTEEGRQRYGLSEGGNRKLYKDFHKDMEKLRKLDARSSIRVQKDKYERFSKQAKKDAKIGIALATAGEMSGVGSYHVYQNSNSPFKNSLKAYGELLGYLGLGSGAVMLAKSGIEKAKAGAAKRRMTPEYQVRELAKRRAHYEKMVNTYKDTLYADLLASKKR